MKPELTPLPAGLTRREALSRSACGFGSLALGALLAKHYPADGENPNRIPDRLVEI